MVHRPNQSTSRDVFRLGCLILVSVLVGGGGTAYGFNNLLVQLLGILILAVSPGVLVASYHQAPKILGALLLVTAALPLTQIVPLPPWLWSSFPGRELIAESFELADLPKTWFPISVAPNQTLVAALGTITPFTILAVGWLISKRDLIRLQELYVCLGLLCAGLGMVLLLAGNNTGIFPEPAMNGVLFGTFANRNSTGLFLVCCLVLMATLPTATASMRRVIVYAIAGVILVIAVLLTQSRSSMALLAVPFALLLIRAKSELRLNSLPGSSKRLNRLLAVALFASIMIGGWAVLNSDRVQISLARFDSEEVKRPQMWEDTITSAKRFWPLGSGMGTFAEVFQVDESLEHVSPRTAGRAHGDYFEIALEAGLAGVGLVALWLMWWAAASWKAWRNEAGLSAAGGACVLLCIALQSIVDYPLRTETLPCLAAFAVLLLARGTCDNDWARK